MRSDEPNAVMQHKDNYLGGTALIVLGGPSAKNWKIIREVFKPDVVIGVNGVNKEITNLDYWLCTENMAYPSGRANAGDPRYVEIMDMFQRTGATTRLVNRKTHHMLYDNKNTIKIRRSHVEVDELDNFSFREYGEGLMNGALMDRPETGVPLRAGTVGLQAMHLAGILGVSNIHTIGFDLCFKKRHHWYDYPKYKATRFFNEEAFTKHKGLKTMWFWVDTMEYLKEIEPILERDGITWTDHSNGLLEKEGLKCTAMKVDN